MERNERANRRRGQNLRVLKTLAVTDLFQRRARILHRGAFQGAASEAAAGSVRQRGPEGGRTPASPGFVRQPKGTRKEAWGHVKSSRTALAAGLMAGLAALPLTASAADAAPTGSASASALHVQISLAPLAATVNGTGALGQLHDAFEMLKTALCGAQAPTCDLGLSIPKTLPDSLTLDVAQALVDSTTYNAAGNDLVSGKSSSTPIATDWAALNTNITALQTLLTNLINQGTGDLAPGNTTAPPDPLSNHA